MADPSLTYGVMTSVWDASGNLLSDGISTYSYDSANRLTSIVGSQSMSSYVYNGLGDRLQQTVESVPTNYTLDLNTGLTQVLADDTNAYLYGNGRISQHTSHPAPSMSYFLSDALGSVRQMSDATGTVTLAQSYAPYGGYALKRRQRGQCVSIHRRSTRRQRVDVSAGEISG